MILNASTLHILTHCFGIQLRNVFGGAHHSPHALFSRVSKMHNSGRVLLFIKPSECRMGGEAIQLLCVMRLRDTLLECMASKVFLEMKKFQYIGAVARKDEFWALQFSVCQMLYPLYRLLRLCDMKVGGIDKVKFYVVQVDRLLDEGLDRVLLAIEKMGDNYNNLANAVDGGNGGVIDFESGEIALLLILLECTLTLLFSTYLNRGIRL